MWLRLPMLLYALALWIFSLRVVVNESKIRESWREEVEREFVE